MTENVISGRKSRPERLVALTDEFVSSLPDAKSGSDLWYDAGFPRLSVLRYPRAVRPTYRYVIKRAERQATGLSSMTPYIKLGAFTTVDEAMAKAKAIHERVTEALALYRSSGRITDLGPDIVGGNHIVPPEDILKDRSPEEHAKYEDLMGVLMDAYTQATQGKGAERHAGGDISFKDQDMMQIMDRVGVGFAYGQAIKKIVEAKRMQPPFSRNELLGAIIYLAGSIVWSDRSKK